MNLLLVAIITLTCLILKQKKSKLVLTNYRYEKLHFCSFICDNTYHLRAERQQSVKNDPVYEIPTLERQAAQKQELSGYVNLPQRQKGVKMSFAQKRHAKSNDGAGDIKLEDNPSYRTASYGNL